MPFGKFLTRIARLPSGAQRDLHDPYAETVGLYATIVVILLLAGGWYLGRLDQVLPGKIKSTSVLGTSAPAWKPPLPPASASPTNAPPTG